MKLWNLPLYIYPSIQQRLTLFLWRAEYRENDRDIVLPLGVSPLSRTIWLTNNHTRVSCLLSGGGMRYRGVRRGNPSLFFGRHQGRLLEWSDLELSFRGWDEVEQVDFGGGAGHVGAQRWGWKKVVASWGKLCMAFVLKCIHYYYCKCFAEI